MELMDRIDEVVARCTPAEVPLLVGRLEAAKHRALLRLSAASLPEPANDPGQDPDEVLPMLTVASKLGRHEETVRRWAREGKITAVVDDYGRVVGMRRGDLLAYIHQRRRLAS